METNKDGSKKFTLSNILGWIVGVVILIIGLISITKDPISGIMFVIASLLLVPPAYKFLSKKFNIDLSKGLRIFIFLTLVVLGVTFTGTDTPKNVDKTSSSQRLASPALTVTSVELSEGYEANQIAADNLYRGKLVKIGGVVDSIGKDILDNPYVVLKGSTTNFWGVQCMFIESKMNNDMLASLSEGVPIVVQGKVSGEVIGNVLVNNCNFVLEDTINVIGDEIETMSKKYIVESEEFEYMESEEINLWKSYSDRTLVGKVKRGDVVEVIKEDKENNYCLVVFNNQEGWTSCEWLQTS